MELFVYPDPLSDQSSFASTSSVHHEPQITRKQAHQTPKNQVIFHLWIPYQSQVMARVPNTYFIPQIWNVALEKNIYLMYSPLGTRWSGKIQTRRSFFSVLLATRPRTLQPASARCLRQPMKVVVRSYSLKSLRLGIEEHFPNFKYKRLNWASNEIRLVKILQQETPHDSSDGEPLECSIHSVSLDSKTKYCALSYAWGDNTRNQPIYLNGKLTYITQSLDKALRQLRSLSDSDKEIVALNIWVDAICINQQDDLEKAWQVQQMGRIFHDAYRVIVWLGPASDSSNEAIEILKQISRGIKEGHEPIGNSALEFSKLLAEPPEGFGQALNSLLSRPWWKRVWVVQEFAVAKDAIFLCGDTMLLWHHAYDALDALDKHKRVLLNKSFEGPIGGEVYRRSMAEMAAISSTLRLFKIRSDWNRNQKLFFLWDLLKVKDDGMEATDHRDLIYAMTGIAADAQQYHLYPDYTKRLQDVFTQVATAFLVQGRLRMLWLCSQPRKLVKLPSWVPDWSSAWRKNYRYFSIDGTYGAEDRIFAASGDSQPIVSFSADNQTALLHLDGCKFDVVENIGSPFDIGRFLETSRFDFHHIHQGIAERFQEISRLQSRNITKNGDARDARDAILRTAVADIEISWSPDIRFTYRRAKSSSIRELYSKYVGNWEEWDLDNTNDMAASKLDILFRSHGRWPFITAKGHLGLGPAGLRRGDVVAIIYGAELPFVFRENGEGKFQLVGEAYVDGIMDGQILEMGIPSTTFDVV